MREEDILSLQLDVSGKNDKGSSNKFKPTKPLLLTRARKIKSIPTFSSGTTWFEPGKTYGMLPVRAKAIT
jgi:hypothetical protein